MRSGLKLRPRMNTIYNPKVYEFLNSKLLTVEKSINQMTLIISQLFSGKQNAVLQTI